MDNHGEMSSILLKVSGEIRGACHENNGIPALTMPLGYPIANDCIMSFHMSHICMAKRFLHSIGLWQFSFVMF